ncbi:MAG: DNA alkylation repair protein [Proteobacteria bacterium]|nr:DNA alkylation repair protein [Pseudomonadota bacterium]
MSAQGLAAFVRTSFEALANPEHAAPMAAYMKTEQPFYRIKKPLRVPVYRAMKREHPPADQAAYEAGVRALWALPHRECQYTAIEYATQHRRFITSASLPLYEELIRVGAWWDLVDPIASHLVGGVWLAERASTELLMDRWIEDECLWIRRTALIGQLRHKERTDTARLTRYCLARAHEQEFFIRKAIGWALRQHSWTDPDFVRGFLRDHREQLSGLSFREASKRIPDIRLTNS